MHGGPKRRPLIQIPDWALTPKQLIAKRNKLAALKRSEEWQVILAFKRIRREIKLNQERIEAEKRRKRTGKYGLVYGALEGEAEILKLILTLHEKGSPTSMIAHYLNEKNFPARGRRWYDTSIKRIIQRVVKTNGEPSKSTI